jgi:hypothetical protein
MMGHRPSLVPWVLTVLGVASMIGCFDPLVGVTCGSRYTVCGTTCVNTASSQEHCGGCDSPCEGLCTQGLCVESLPDGHAVDRAGDGVQADTRDAGAFPDAPDGIGGDARDTPAPDQAQDQLIDQPMDRVADGPVDAAEVLPPDAATDTADAAVDTAEASPPDVATDPQVCATDTAICVGRCVDIYTDPDHCGDCNNRCISGLCNNAKCSIKTPGHLVVIGHDYVEGREGMNNLVGNAVFLAPSTLVKVLVYEGRSSPTAIQGTNRAVDQVAASRGRSWERTKARPANVPALLGTVDVFLVYAQADETDAGLQALGKDWSAALKNFIDAGKIIVLLEGAHAHAGTFQILSEAGLFAATGRTPVTSQILTVQSPGDSIATQVPGFYLAEMSSVEFETSETTVVVRAQTKPVVIHHVF